MHLELVDLLRCPRPHEASPLIATIEQAYGRSIDRGVLGCPICDSRYAIEAGGVTFDDDTRSRCLAAPSAPPPAAEATVRAAALLGLTEPGGVILLGGVTGALAAPLRDAADVTMILYNPPGPAGGRAGATPIYARGLPVAGGALRGALLDEDTAPAAADVVAALRPGARLVAPARTPLPAGLRELARDEMQWVAERPVVAASAPVPLRRGSSAQSPG